MWTKIRHKAVEAVRWLTHRGSGEIALRNKHIGIAHGGCVRVLPFLAMPLSYDGLDITSKICEVWLFCTGRL